MNFLTHLYFAGNSVDTAVGLIIGNTAKPTHLAKYNLDVLKGIAMDLQIRHFSETHPAFIRSQQRVNHRYTSYAAVLVTMFYDHLLAKKWNEYSNISLEEFAHKMYSAVAENWDCFPNDIRKFSPMMIEKKWITSITSIEGIHQHLDSISGTVRLPKFVEQGFFELIENYSLFNNEFEEYFADLCRFMVIEEQRFLSITDKKEMFLISA